MTFALITRYNSLNYTQGIIPELKLHNNRERRLGVSIPVHSLPRSSSTFPFLLPFALPFPFPSPSPSLKVCVEESDPKPNTSSLLQMNGWLWCIKLNDAQFFCPAGQPVCRPVAGCCAQEGALTNPVCRQS